MQYSGWNIWNESDLTFIPDFSKCITSLYHGNSDVGLYLYSLTYYFDMNIIASGVNDFWNYSA